MLVVLDQAGRGWPSADEWCVVLPGWFVEACAVERTPAEDAQWLAWWHTLPPDEQARAEEEQAWQLTEWLYWLEPQRREWYVWRVAVLTNDVAEVQVVVRGWPAPLDALRWLLKAAGAAEVVMNLDE